MIFKANIKPKIKKKRKKKRKQNSTSPPSLDNQQSSPFDDILNSVNQANPDNINTSNPQPSVNTHNINNSINTPNQQSSNNTNSDLFRTISILKDELSTILRERMAMLYLDKNSFYNVYVLHVSLNVNIPKLIITPIRNTITQVVQKNNLNVEIKWEDTSGSFWLAPSTLRSLSRIDDCFYTTTTLYNDYKQYRRINVSPLLSNQSVTKNDVASIRYTKRLESVMKVKPNGEVIPRTALSQPAHSNRFLYQYSIWLRELLINNQKSVINNMRKSYMPEFKEHIENFIQHIINGSLKNLPPFYPSIIRGQIFNDRVKLEADSTYEDFENSEFHTYPITWHLTKFETGEPFSNQYNQPYTKALLAIAAYDEYCHTGHLYDYLAHMYMIADYKLSGGIL